MFRRKALPVELVPAEDAFRAVLNELEPAKAALAEAMPGTRLPGRPLGDALEEFTSRLTRALALMPGWRLTPLGAEWMACENGLEESISLARRIQRGLEPAGFTSLLGLVQALLDPLDPFQDAEVAFRFLRS
jgi:hypothetical protein